MRRGLLLILTKFVVRKAWIDFSRKIEAYDNLERAIDVAKSVYKNQNAKLLGFEVVVEEARYADEKKLNQDFAIDRHIRWASYFNEI
jgi:hypothetical protein